PRHPGFYRGHWRQCAPPTARRLGNSRESAPARAWLERYPRQPAPLFGKDKLKMKPEVSAFGWVPPFAQGLVRDLRVRWALREAGRDYDELLIGPQGQSSEDYRRLQPFGQVP